MHHTHTTSSTLASNSTAHHFFAPLPTRRSLLCGLLVIILQLFPGLWAHSANDTPGSGTLILHHPQGDLDALVLDADMNLQVQGLLAEMRLTQTFRNSTDQWVQASYLFPLPPEAAIRALSMVIGERTITGEIQAREQAKKTYDTAQRAGQIASLVEQQRPNLFTMNVANIAPGELIKVTLDVMLPVQMLEQQLQLRLPTTLTPRYTQPASADAQALQSNFALPRDIRGPRLNVQIQIAPLSDYSLVTSSTHSLERPTNAQDNAQNKTSINTQANTPNGMQNNTQGLHISNMPMDQDIVLSWPAQYEQSTRVHAFVSRFDNERYVQLLVNPPATTELQQNQRRELILVVDKSGSMAGVSMKAAIEALNYAIDGLGPDDSVNIIAFDQEHYPLFSASRQATDSVKQEARKFANGLVANGGTEMDSALSFALGNHRQSALFPLTAAKIAGEAGDKEDYADKENNGDNEERLRQVVFVTDGSVGYEDELLMRIKTQLGSSRLFTVGIGPSPNTWFLDKAAEAGRGVSVSIQNEHDVAQSITALLSYLENPVVTDIALQYTKGYGEVYPRPLPDLYAGRAGMWISKISNDVDEIIITGKHNAQRWRHTVELPDMQAEVQPEMLPELHNEQHAVLSASAPAVAMHWTRLKIETLMDEQRYATDKELNKAAITRLAMQVGLLTPYTSFVAVEEQPGRPLDQPLRDHEVANLIPKGNDMMSIQIPKGAAGADTLMWLSLIAGMAGFCLFGLARRARQATHA